MSGQSRLISLPSELRNRIYEFALSASTPLYFLEARSGNKAVLVPATSPHPPNRPQAVEFNQLKYTSKQLYIETAGLEVKLNNILVCSQWAFVSPAKKLLVWLSSMSRARMAWEKTITIMFDVKPDSYGVMCFDMPEEAETIAQLSHVCTSHPAIKIRYMLPRWQLQPDPTSHQHLFFCQAIYYTLAFRGHDLAETLFPRNSTWQSHMKLYSAKVQHWRNNIILEDLQAPNLLFLPADADEHLHISRTQIIAPSTNLSPESWVGKDLTLKWLKEGL